MVLALLSVAARQWRGATLQRQPLPLSEWLGRDKSEKPGHFAHHLRLSCWQFIEWIRFDMCSSEGGFLTFKISETTNGTSPPKHQNSWKTSSFPIPRRAGPRSAVKKRWVNWRCARDWFNFNQNFSQKMSIKSYRTDHLLFWNCLTKMVFTLLLHISGDTSFTTAGTTGVGHPAGLGGLRMNKNRCSQHVGCGRFGKSNQIWQTCNFWLKSRSIKHVFMSKMWGLLQYSSLMFIQLSLERCWTMLPSAVLANLGR